MESLSVAPFPFLALPCEIRDMVYTSLLVDDLPAQSSPQQLRKTTTIFPFWQLDTRWIHVPPHFEPTVQNLLASNSQIRHELQAKLQRRGSRCRPRYYLDCMIVGDTELFPYWRNVPAPVQYMHQHFLQIDVRSSEDDAQTSKRTAHSSGMWMNSAFKVLELIEEFFNRGPTFRRVSELREDIKVHTVLVNVLRPDNALDDHDPEPTPTKGNRHRGREKRLPNGNLHPATMYKLLTDHVQSFKRTLQGRAKILRICYMNNISEHSLIVGEIKAALKTRTIRKPNSTRYNRMST